MPTLAPMLRALRCNSKRSLTGRLQSHPWSQASRLSDYVHQNVDPANTGSVQRLQESSAHGALCRPIHTASCIPLTEAIASPTDIDLLNRRRIRIGSPLTEATLFPHSLQAAQQQRHFARHAEEYSDDDYGYENNKGSPSYVNVDEWKWKLNVLVRNPREQEIVSNEKKDRRDFEYLAPLARRLGLHSQMYGKYVVFSKVPLPNYRPDLDDKRPVRKVSIPLAVHKVVDSLLQEHLDRKQIYRRQNMKDGISNQAAVGQIADSINIDNKQPENQSEQSDPLMKSPIAEDILYRRSMRLRSKQQAWQESREGQKMNAFRKTLPAYKEREALLSAVAKNQVLVISGETGCGKTTQLPQYILESEIEAGRGGSCSIICTQPRRISAMSVAERVAAERGEELGDSIGYKVRLEGVKGRATRLLFCTTGILLRRLLVDPSLKGVTHVIVDEIHERGMNEDFLLIVLKDLLPSRPDLKLVLMSATLNAELFSSFFGGAPMHHIPGFTYPVKEYFLEDILELTGHRLTEYNQIDDYGQDKMWKMQKQMQNKRRKNALNCLVEDALVDADFRAYSGMTQYSVSHWSAEGLGFNLIQAVLCHICKHEREGAVLVFMTGWDDINALKDLLNSHPLLGNPSKVLLVPCHGAMASKDQKLIFEHPSPHVRKIVLATNMAETSITINDVVFVVDCGKAKETSYDALNNTPCLTPTWISKASARQRRGRAGRVQPGECYHLYPRAVYEAFAEYQQPELLRVPLHSLCLQIKSLKLGSIGGFLSKALQPPEALSVQNSVELLKTLGALDHKEELTHLGHHLSMLPVEPTVGKLLIMGAVFRCVEPVLTIAAGLTLRDPFLLPMDKKLMAEKARYSFGADDCSDHIALVRAYEGWLTAMREGNAIDYCWKNFLSFQTLQAMQSLRNQFRGLLKEAKFLDADNQDCNEYSSDRDLLGGVICAGLFPGIASVLSNNRNTHFKTVEDGQVLLNQNCVLSRMDKIPYPWLAFNEKVKTGTVIIRDSTGVSDTVLLLFGGKVETGGKEGHLVMQDGWLEFFMLPELAETILVLKEELDFLLCRKLEDPKLDIYEEGRYLINAVFELLHGDQNEGVFTEVKDLHKRVEGTSSLQDVKGLLQNRLQKDGFKPPKYKVKERRDDLFEAYVELKGQQFIGKPATSKKQAEKNAAADALEWLDSAPSSGKQEGRPKFKQGVSNNRRSSTPAVSENGGVLNVHGTVASRSRASTKDRGTALSKIKETLLSEDSLHKKRALSQQSKLEEAESTKAIKAQIRKIIKGHTDGSFMCN